MISPAHSCIVFSSSKALKQKRKKENTEVKKSWNLTLTLDEFLNNNNEEKKEEREKPPSTLLIKNYHHSPHPTPLNSTNPPKIFFQRYTKRDSFLCTNPQPPQKVNFYPHNQDGILIPFLIIK
eukprot:TRINITY_DN6411_c0_g1_i2.p1 TRINITY_DN6411_c0_g1~~TRINITY_DN6411_c0_g1_i2.p1  ORF type:complete len:123 (+),score=5.43 TRINITY_DN6411_c0_g1_i2:333-701(+)